jgi:hypothetical protein
MVHNVQQGSFGVNVNMSKGNATGSYPASGRRCAGQVYAGINLERSLLPIYS